MINQKSLMVLAGAALGLSSAAMAQEQAVDELKSDAATRSSFQGDTGFPTMDWSGYTQFQFNLNVRDDGPANAAFVGDDSLTTGFRFANTKLIAQGKVAEEWSYYFQGAFASNGGAFGLQDMYATYAMDNGWELQAGQKKLPFLREELVSDTGQQAAERSVYNEQFSLGRAQGIFVNYTADEFRVMGAFTDGAGTQNTEITSTLEADYAFTARAEWKWAGDWDRFRQFSSWNGSENAGMVGGAVHVQDGGSTVGTAENQTWGGTLDVTIQGSGWNVFGSGVFAHRDPSGTSASDDIGLLAQGGFFVTDDWELFGRGTYNLADDATPEPDDFWTITGGANWFITPQSQNAKLTIELVYAGEQTLADNGASNFLLARPDQGFAGGTGSETSGILADAEGGQFLIRGQLQIKF